LNQTLIPIGDRKKWTEALQQVPYAFGHTWESCYAISLTTGLDTYLYHFEDDGVHIVCPFSERVYGGHVDVYTPYGFSGFVCNQGYDGFSLIWEKFAADHNYVCGYITMNPFLNRPMDVLNKDAASANDLYSLDLNMSLDQLFLKLSTNRKRQVKNHHEILTSLTQDKIILKDFFINNFHDFFKGRGADLLTSFTRDTLSSLVDLDNVILIGKMADGEVEAVSVFAYTHYVAEYLFNISKPGGKSHTVPLLWEGIRNLNYKGVPILNLGGGIKRGDSLAEFKERFGAEKFPLTVLKQVYNQECRKISLDSLKASL